MLASEVLGENQPFWIIVPDRVTPEWMAPSAIDKAQRARLHRLRARYGLTPRWEYYSTSDKCIYHIQAAEAVWRANRFNHLLLSNYHEDVRDIILMNAQTGAVFAPYVAGVYLSQPTPWELITLLNQYYGWLPIPGDGVLRFDPAQMKSGKFEVSKSCAAAIEKSLGNTTGNP